MRRLALIAFVAFIFASSAFSFTAEAYFVLPSAKPSGFVNDFAGVLSPEQKLALESKLAAFNATTTIEIAIVTVKSLGGDTVEQAAREIFDSWGIGKTKQDNGVLVLVSAGTTPEDRRIRIEPGYGLEGALTDIQSSQIIQNDMAPAFKEGRYYDGFSAGVDSIIAAVRGETGTPSGGVPGGIYNNIAELVFSFGWFFPILFIFLVRGIAIFLGKTKSWWLGGVLGAVFGGGIGFFAGSLATGITAAIFTGLFGLLFDYGVSKSYDKWKSGGGRGGGPWIGGGGFGGGSHGGGFGGGGFGGFGGGRSGGGGASGGF